MNFIDIHCHLAESYFWKQIDELMTNWIEIGIKKIGAVATNVKSSKRNLELAEKFPREILVGIGRHPWGAHKFNEQEKELFEGLIKEPKVAIVGEIGLDRYFIREPEKFPKQQEVFQFFLEQANKNNKPVMLHTTGAEKAVSDILSTFELNINVCCHWYSGPAKELRELTDKGCYFSINPAIVRSRNHQRVLEIVDKDFLLTESDGAVKFQGKPGSPALMPFVYQEVSSRLNLSIEEFALIVELNLERYLGRRFH